MAFGILFAQTKTTDHTPDFVIWLVAILALSAALLIVWKQERGPQAVEGWVPDALYPLYQVIIGGQILFCAWVIVGALQHLHSL
jgi:hypothetical protein